MTVRKELASLSLGQAPFPTPVTATQGDTVVIPILQITKPRPDLLVRPRKPETSKIPVDSSGQTFSIFCLLFCVLSGMRAVALPS